MADFDSSAKALDALNTLGQTLARGNLSSGTSIILSVGDGMVSPDATSGAGNVLNLAGGDNSGGSVPDTGGDVSISGGSGNAGAGGTILIAGGDSSGVAGGGVNLTPGTGPGGDGLVFITRSGIQMIERAAIPGPAISAGQGRLWVRSDTPNVLVYTGDDGVDHDIVAGAATALSSVLTVGNTTGGTNIEVSSGDNIVGEDQTVAVAPALTIRQGDSTFNDGADNGLLTIRAGDRANTGLGDASALLLRAGDMSGAGNARGGDLTLRSGDGNLQSNVDILAGTVSANNPSGSVTVRGGANDGGGFPGDILVRGGEPLNSTNTRPGGDVVVRGGDPGALSGFSIGGATTVRGGDGGDSGGTGGALTLRAGNGTSGVNSEGGDLTMDGGLSGGNRQGGLVTINAGSNVAGSGTGGILTLGGGDGGTTGDGGNIVLTPGGVTSGTEGIVDLTRSGIQFQERATRTITPAAGKGFLWVRSDGPNVLVFTDDAGTDTALGAGGGGGGESFAATLAIGNTSGGTDIALTGTDSLITLDAATPVVLSIASGASTSGGGAGAEIDITAGAGDTSGAGGAVDINAGVAGATGVGGGITLDGGAGGGTSGNGGSITLTSGTATEGDGGDVSLIASPGVGTDQTGGDVIATAGASTGTIDGGSITLTAGAAGGSGDDGRVQILGPGTLELLERASVIGTPAAGRGYLWLRSDTPNVLVFTDDTGSDTDLGAGGAGGGFTWVATKSGAYTALVNESVPIDPSGGTFTVDFPAAPASGDAVRIKNVTTSTTAITVDGNGNSVEDPFASFALTATISVSGDGFVATWEYNGSDWLVV